MVNPTRRIRGARAVARASLRFVVPASLARDVPGALAAVALLLALDDEDVVGLKPVLELLGRRTAILVGTGRKRHGAARDLQSRTSGEPTSQSGHSSVAVKVAVKT